MMPGPGSRPVPKPEPRARVKGRAKRKASAVVRDVRAACVARDGYCRVGACYSLLGPCGGDSQWAHLKEKQRSKTRGQPAEVRHTTQGSLMLCSQHHDRYDGRAGPKLTITAVSPDGAEGAIRFEANGITVLSMPK